MHLFSSAVILRLRQMRFTLAVILINIIVFVIAIVLSGSGSGTSWNTVLLRLGAQFAPLTLDKEGYRIVSHLFIHASFFHLLLNQYLLAYLGYHLEGRFGSRRIILLFFASGVSAALSSMYLNLFTVGVGTSGAISGMFGFYLVYQIFVRQKRAAPAMVLLLHFACFAALNILWPNALASDYAGLFGGVAAGVFIGFLSSGGAVNEKRKLEYLLVPVIVLLFLLMPGYQVRYFRFFKQVVAAEDTTRHLIKEKLTDEDMRTFIRNLHHWEAIQVRLLQQSGLPADLSTDTFRLARYIGLRKQENLLKKKVVQEEAYAYLDSIERLQEVMRKYMDLDYPLWSRIKAPDIDSALEARMTTIYFDSTGAEVAHPLAVRKRTGVRDSDGRWNGPFREYDEHGRLRIKGFYKENKKDGVFLYYSESGVCVEAGRYLDDKRFGKWQTFYLNGRICSEVFYTGGTFVKNVWDSLGNQQVVDGNGRETRVYADDVVNVTGEYRHGVKDGMWFGRYRNGDMCYEEEYSQGRLVSGKSRAPDGRTFVYDESSLFAFPEEGFARFDEYLKREVKKINSDEFGHVKLTFKVDQKGAVTDVAIVQSASPTLDESAKKILVHGPKWFPARKHGYIPIESVVDVRIDFY